jgi:hypothetical protein
MWGHPRRDITSSVAEGSKPPASAAPIVDRIAGKVLESSASDAVIDRVVDALLRSTAIERLTNKVAAVVEDSPAVDALLERKVAQMLQALTTSDALASLVEAQGSRYLDQLAEHPETVRELLQIQSRDAFGQFLDSIRARARAADDSLNHFVQRVLKRP